MRRHQRISWLVLAIAAIAMAGWLIWLSRQAMPRVAVRALAEAEEYELLSLRPEHSRPDFYGHEILGRTTIADAATRERLNRALQAGARANDGRMGACFNPRHGIRATRAGVTTDFVICFECEQVQVWRGGVQIAFFLTNAWPEGVFDGVLRQVGVPLAPKQ